MKQRRPEPQRLLDRQCSDENFAHTIGLLGWCSAFAETIRENQRVTFNDTSMIQIPCEIALAFCRLHQSDQSPLGVACKKALGDFTAARAARDKTP